jgi:hypothetical protein
MNSLLSQNFLRYALYAAGEILLIVTGIMIALWVNNWNAQSKLSVKEDFYLEGLLEEFRVNEAKLKVLIEVNRENVGEAQRIAGFFHRDSLPSEGDLSQMLYRALFREIAYNPNNSLLREILAAGELSVITNPDLRMHLINWEPRIETLFLQEERLSSQRSSLLNTFQNEGGSIYTIVSGRDGKGSEQSMQSNFGILQSTPFENHLILFILNGESTEAEHYLPLLEEIQAIMRKLEMELDRKGLRKS